MKIFRTGIFKNQLKCCCENTRQKKGFYSCNEEGNYQRDLLGRGGYYACAQCGRIIDRKTLEVVGLTKGYKLSPWEVGDLVTGLLVGGVEPVGVGYRYMMARSWPRRYSALG